MKNIYIIATLILIFLNRAAAQDNNTVVNGNSFVNQLADQRYQFNKSLIKGSRIQLPEAKSIFASNSSVVFDGHTYVLKNNEVVEIKGFLLSKSALAAITNKLFMLDAFQRSCAEEVNNIYNQPVRDLQYVKNKDRQYFSALKQILSITAAVADQYQKPNASVTIEMAVNKLKVPYNDSRERDEQNISLAKIK